MMEWSRDILEELRFAKILVRLYTGINQEKRTYIGIIVPFLHLWALSSFLYLFFFLGFRWGWLLA
jgi:hypothetical protein